MLRSISLLLLLTLVAAPALAQSKSPGHEKSFDESITPEELLDKAREAFGLDDYELAEEFYQELLRRQPSNEMALLELANVYERDGKLEYARGLMIRATKVAPDDPLVREKLRYVEKMLTLVLNEEVELLIEHKEYEQAVAKLSMQLDVTPDDPDVLFKKSLCLSELGQYSGAMKAINHAIQIDPRETFYEFKSGIVSRWQHVEADELRAQAQTLASSGKPGDRAQALELLSQILELDPDNEWAQAEFRRLNDLENAPPETDEPAPGPSWSERVDRLPGQVMALLHSLVGFIQLHVGWFSLLAIVLLIFRSPLSRFIIKAFTPHPLLAGQLANFSLPEILMMLNAEPHTGVLRVKGKGVSGTVYFESGEPCHCAVGKIKGKEALIHLLNNCAEGQFTFANGSMPLDRTIDTPLGLILAERARSAAGDRQTGGKRSKMKELLDSRT